MKPRRAGIVLFLTLAFIGMRAAPVSAAPVNPPVSSHDPWATSQVIQPESLERVLKTVPGSEQPLLVHVGFPFLYKSGHIPGSVYAGPAKEDKGLSALRARLAAVPREREIVLYCGCCPLVRCPNLRPAYRAAREMGFANVKILYLPDDLNRNWIKRGYLTEK